MTKKIILWVLAVAITFAAAIYQRMTGPTYPKKEKITLNGKEYKLKFLRSHGGDTDAQIKLKVDDASINAKIYYKIYPPKASEDWTVSNFKTSSENGENMIVASLPYQEPAGKVMYYVEFISEKETKTLFKEKPIVVRFKGAVPKGIIIPHIIFMFLGMLIANAAGLFAAFKLPQQKLYALISLILIFLGGMILGPIVQKYAFLEYWAGVPFGWDLTDNKLLIAFVAWLIAWFGNMKTERRYLTVIAAVVTLLIFSIPHSMFGSELDRETGKVIQGFINMTPF